MREREADLFYWASRLAILFLLPLHISDVWLYHKNGMGFLQEGRIPYLHWPFEYPPLAFPLMALPAWLQQLLGMEGVPAYRVLFGLVLLPFDLFLHASFQRRPPFPGAAFHYTLLTSLLCLLLFDRFDLLVGFVLAFPFLWGWRGEGRGADLRSALAWGLGGALKLVPLLLVPLRLLAWGRLSPARLVRYGALAALPILLSVLGVSYLTGGNVPFLSHHAERGVQIESLLASLVYFRKVFLLGEGAEVVSNFGAQHMAADPFLVALSRLLFLVSLGFTYIFILWQRRRWCPLTASWLVISCFVTFGYVLSPQFLLWLVPLGLCAAGRVEPSRRFAWLLLFALACGLTGAHFRYYWSYVKLEPLPVLVVLGRNLSLVLLWCLSWRWMNQHGPEERPGIEARSA